MPESNSDSRAKILVVDDEPNIRELIKMRLVSLGYEVTEAAGGAEARAAAAQVVLDLAIIDLKLGAGEDGLQVMEQLFLINPQLPVIILTAHGSIENAVDAIKKGAYSYLTKPYKPEELAVQVKNALEKQRLTKEVTLLKGMLQERFAVKNIVGQSPQMKEILNQVANFFWANRFIDELCIGECFSFFPLFPFDKGCCDNDIRLRVRQFIYLTAQLPATHRRHVKVCNYYLGIVLLDLF